MDQFAHDKIPNIQLDMARLPRHIAIIMDGNGRWAQAQGLQRAAGPVSYTHLRAHETGRAGLWRRR
ncbi:MAG: hypothetical protein K2L99_05220, partial [Muribaculaceae bacterium]|nr:hypothetical protein [Muribaculaceae bacterium]